MTGEDVPGNLRAANALRAGHPTLGSGTASSVPVVLAAWRSGSPDSMGGVLVEVPRRCLRLAGKMPFEPWAEVLGSERLTGALPTA